MTQMKIKITIKKMDLISQLKPSENSLCYGKPLARLKDFLSQLFNAHTIVISLR